MNILLINHYAGSPRHGMEFRPYYMAQEWKKLGHDVLIIAASHSHIRANNPVFDERSLDEQVDGVPYRWYRTSSYRGNGAGRVLNMLQFIWALWRDGKQLARDFKPDVVIASSTYPMDIRAAHRIARLSGAKLVYEVHDLWPLSPMELGGMSRWHPFILWVQSAEDYAYRHSDTVVSMLPKAREHMCSRGLDERKYIHVPNGVNEQEWLNPVDLPGAVAGELARMRESGIPIVCYAGTQGLANSLDVLLDASRLLKGKAQVLLVGKGPDRDRLQARVNKEGLTNVVMLPAIPKEAMPTLLEQVDIAFIGLLPQPLFRFGISPNKLMDYMMAAKPIVMSIKAGNDPVTDAGCGITVPPGDPQAVAEAVLKLVGKSEPERLKMGRRGREFILENQTFPVLAKKMLAGIGITQNDS